MLLGTVSTLEGRQHRNTIEVNVGPARATDHIGEFGCGNGCPLSTFISFYRSEYENAAGKIHTLSEGRGDHDNRKPPCVQESCTRIQERARRSTVLCSSAKL